jgi:hypothetical protein
MYTINIIAIDTASEELAVDSIEDLHIYDETDNILNIDDDDQFQSNFCFPKICSTNNQKYNGFILTVEQVIDEMVVDCCYVDFLIILIVNKV